MPTKLNHAGQQQNYVPSGNGDASGEYGDNETGSNIHFKVFKRPDDSTPIKDNEVSIKDFDSAVSYLDESLKKYDRYREENKQTLGYFTAHDYDKIKELYNSDRVKEKDSIVKMANAYRNAAENGKPYFVVNDVFYSGHACYFKGIKADPEQKGILIQPRTFEKTNNLSYGTTWFHENGHLLDNTYENGTKDWSIDYVSKKYNDTLQNVLNEEFKTYFTKERKQEIIDKIENIRNSVYFGYGYNYKEMEEQKKYFNDLLLPYKRKLKEDYALLDEKYKKGEIDGWQHIVGRSKIKERYQRDTWGITNQISRLISPNEKKKIELKVADQVYANYSTISDMYSSLGKGRLHPEYGGYHDKKYWQSDPNKRVKEFFAEAFSGKTLGNTHYNQLKAAFPKSCEIFEEIYKEIK